MSGWCARLKMPDSCSASSSIDDHGPTCRPSRSTLTEAPWATSIMRVRFGIDGPAFPGWQLVHQQRGRGRRPAIDLGVHVLDMALWLMDDPVVTRASAATYAKLGPQGIGNWTGNRFSVTPDTPYEVEDFASAFLRTDAGATLYVEASWAEFSSRTDEFGVALLGTRAG